MDEFDALVEGSRDILWWHRDLRDREGLLSTLTADFKSMSDVNERIVAYDTFASLYVNRRVDAGSPTLSKFQAGWAMDSGRYTRVPYNLMKQVIDEVTARIIKTHPHARFMTHGGDPEAQRRAEMMERWNDSQVYQHYQSETFELVIKDACVYGLGAIKIGPAYKESRLDIKRVHPGNLFVDLNETTYDKPQRIHHRIRVQKSTLKMFFPKFAEQIQNAGKIQSFDTFDDEYPELTTSASDTIDLIESWHLPSFAGAPDGKRILWVSSAILNAGPYQRRSFPFSFFTWKNDPTNTFYGIGLAEDLYGIHIDANATLNRVNTAIEKASVPRWAYREGTITDAHIRNLPGIKTPYTGEVPPTYYLDNSVPQDLLAYVREHEARAYKVAGLASAQAFGERIPSGLETGRAVENYFNVESVPFATQLRKFEYFIEDVANANVAAGKEISERDKNWSVVLPGDKNTIETVPWKDISMDPREDSFVIRAAPASMLSELPGSRIGEVERLITLLPSLQANEELIAQLLGMSDLENFRDLFTAQRENGQHMIQMALREGKFTPPSPFMNLGQFIIDATDAEQRAERMGVKEFNIAQLRRMIRVANEKRQKQQIAREMQAGGMITPTSMPTDGTGAPPGSMPTTQG